MAMLAVWMTNAVHMKGRKVRMVLMTSGLVVNSDGRNITMHAAHSRALISIVHKDQSRFKHVGLSLVLSSTLGW